MWLIPTAVRRNEALGELLERLPLEVVDEKSQRRTHLVWLAMDRLAEPRYNSLFASHRQWLDLIRRSYHPHHKAGTTYQSLSILKQPTLKFAPESYESLHDWMAHSSQHETLSKVRVDDEPLHAVDVAMVRGQRIRLGEGSLRHDVSAMEPAFGPHDIGKLVLLQNPEPMMIHDDFMRGVDFGVQVPEQ